MKKWLLALSGFMLAVPVHAADKSPQAIEAAADAVREARRDMLAEFSAWSPAPGRYAWAREHDESEASRVVLDLSRQLAFVYAQDELIAVSTISSGDADHLSPIGSYRILEKKRMHRSRKYDNAPMPWMQRINEHGVALHAGHLPGYPASHGCVRLPSAFAAKLFAATRIGTEVLLAEPEGPPSRKT